MLLMLMLLLLLLGAVQDYGRGGRGGLTRHNAIVGRSVGKGRL